MSNKKLGNDFENEFCEILGNRGWWVHNLQQNKAGQPADVIAVVNSRAFLIDCKVNSSDRFTFDRIEPNQEYAMKRFEEAGNEPCWFAIKTNEDIIYMVTFRALMDMSMEKASINNKELDGYGLLLDQWLALMERL